MLTDDFYGDLAPMAWRGRELYVPDLAIGRLVEKPQEIEGMIDAFLAGHPLNPNTAFVGGYDFLTDSAQAISNTLGDYGLALTTLISDTWNATQLLNNWANTRQDLASVNAHFDHWQAIPANVTAGTVSATDIIAGTANMSGTVHFSMGCHSGLSVPDEHAVLNATDFAQALARKGAWWIGNTGYGYGMDDSIAFTERVMQLLAEKLTSAPSVPVGEALRWAKNRYIGTVPSGGFGTYDEKAMIEATLYGLPMYEISSGLQNSAARDDAPLSVNTLPTETVSLVPVFQFKAAADGSYYTVDGETQASPGRPVQPRTSVLVPVKPGMTPHGAVLINATSASEPLDPLIARPVTDTKLSEPLFDSPGWFPSNPWAVNRLGDQPRLVVVPAQFKGNQDGGIQRRFTMLNFQVYYTDTAVADLAPPVVWEVGGLAFQDQADFWVTAQDTSGIEQVMMVYTQDDIHWASASMNYSPARDRWERRLTGLTGQFIYFVQVVDGAGNVTATSNKGLFFEPERHQIYLPVVMRQ